MPDRDSQAWSGRLESSGHWAAALWIFGGALYFYIRLTWLLVQDNQAALHALGERLRELLTIG